MTTSSVHNLQIENSIIGSERTFYKRIRTYKVNLIYQNNFNLMKKFKIKQFYFYDSLMTWPHLDNIMIFKIIALTVHFVNFLILLQIKDLGIFVQNDVKSTVLKLMQEIMSNALASNYSFHGAHKKKHSKN